MLDIHRTTDSLRCMSSGVLHSSDQEAPTLQMNYLPRLTAPRQFFYFQQGSKWRFTPILILYPNSSFAIQLPYDTFKQIHSKTTPPQLRSSRGLREDNYPHCRRTPRYKLFWTQPEADCKLTNHPGQFWLRLESGGQDMEPCQRSRHTYRREYSFERAGNNYNAVIQKLPAKELMNLGLNFYYAMCINLYCAT